MQGPTDSHKLTVKDRTRPRLSGSMSTTCSSHGCPSGVATARPTCDHLSGCHPGLSSRAIPHTIVRLATCCIKPAWTKLSTNSKTDHADRITETAEPQTPCRVPRPPNTPNAWDEEQPHSFARSGASSCLAIIPAMQHRTQSCGQSHVSPAACQRVLLIAQGGGSGEARRANFVGRSCVTSELNARDCDGEDRSADPLFGLLRGDRCPIGQHRADHEQDMPR